MSYHGKKPSNPQKAPRNNGRRPSPPPPRTGRNMGKSSFATPGQIKAAWALIAVPFLGIASAVGYVVVGHL